MTLTYQQKPVVSLADLPQHIQNLLWDPRKVKLLEELKRRLSLNPQQSKSLIDAVDDVILGNIHKNRLRFEIQKRLAVSEGAAVTAADEIQKGIAEMEQTPEEPVSILDEKEPLPTIELKPGPPTPTEPPRKTASAPRTTPREAPSLKSLANAMNKPSRPSTNERPSIPLPEDALIKKAPTPTPPATSPPQHPPAAGVSPSEKTIDSYREPIEHNEKRPNRPAPTPIPERPKERRENLGPLINGNIIDLRE